MKKYFIAIAAVVVAFSCAKENPVNNEEPVNEPAKTVKVTFSASVDDTKAAITGKAFSWSKDDEIAVFNANTGTFYAFKLEGDGGSKTGTFSATLADGTYRFTKAYYPASLVTLNTASQNEAQVTLSSEMAASGSASYIPLEGIVSGSSLNFNYMTAILAINVDRVPADATKAVIVPTTGISGTFTVSDNKITATGSGSTALTFTAGSLTGAQTFYYPIPVGSNGFSFKFKNAANEELYSFATTSNKSFVAASYWNMTQLTISPCLYINSSKPWGASTEYVYISDDITIWPGTSYDPDSKTFTHNGESYTKVLSNISPAGASSNMIFHVNYGDSNDAPWYDPYGKLYRAMINSVDLSTDVYISLSTNTDGTHKILLRNWSDNGYMDSFNSWYDGGSAILGDYPGATIASLSTVVYNGESFPFYTATASKKIGVQAVYAAEKDWNHTNSAFIDNLNKNYLVTFKNYNTDPHVFGFPDVVVTLD